MHPLAEDLSELKDAQIEEKIRDLSRKYWQVANPDVKYQISLFLEIYNEEIRTRREKLWRQQHEKKDRGLDNLININ